MSFDGPAIVTAYLKDQTGARVVGRTPNDISTSWVRVTQLDAAAEPNSRPGYLFRFDLQLDCFAGNALKGAQVEASDLAWAVRNSLEGMKGRHGAGVVTGVRFGAMPRIPDDSIEPARERVIVNAHVYMHA